VGEENEFGLTKCLSKGTLTCPNGADGFTSPLGEGVLQIFIALGQDLICES
jgi:hypothetical protein